jgi:hypothetical protein
MEILQFSKYQIIVLIMIKIDCSIGQVRKLNSPMTCAIKSTVVNIGTTITLTLTPWWGIRESLVNVPLISILYNVQAG